MKSKVQKPAKSWSGELVLTFDDKKEAEILLSLFNSCIINDALRDIGAGEYFGSAFYEKAQELGVSNTKYLSDINAAIKGKCK